MRHDGRVLGKEGIDRFDDLPVHILPHILSFLDIQLAVQTSVLSSGWRNTWEDVSALNLSTRSIDVTWWRFRPSICKALQSLCINVTSINIELFDYSGDRWRSGLDLFDSVLKYAAAGRPLQDLSVAAGRDCCLKVEFGVVAYHIFAHHHNQSLKTLRLQSFLLNMAPDAISRHGFHSLTTLALRGCTFDGYDYSAALFETVKLLSFENLQSLKCLKLLYCKSRDPVKLSAPQVLELEIGPCYSLCRFDLVELIAPKLQSFRFRGTLTEVQLLNHFSLPSLDHATIRLIWIEPVGPSPNYIRTTEELNHAFDEHNRRIGEQDRAFENFLLGLRNAESLNLHFVKLDSSCKWTLLKHPHTVTKSLMVYEASLFTRLRILRIQYPHESQFIPDRVIRYHFKISHSVDENIH